MSSRLQPPLRQALQQAVCFFCLLRPLWGWMDRKAEPETPPAPATAAATEITPARSLGLGDCIKSPDPSAPRQPSGAPQ